MSIIKHIIKEEIQKFFEEENKKILVPRRTPEEREKNWKAATLKKIQTYIKNGSEGNLDLENTPITSLPDNLIVGGDLYLTNSKITSLPDNLTVSGWLDLYNTPITSLPNNLKVGGGLGLSNTKISSLPKDLKVGKNLHLRNTPLAEKYTKNYKNTGEKIRQMAPGVKGNIYLY